MKTLLILFCSCLLINTTSAQTLQLTSGPGDELNPSVARTVYYNSYEWLVFERQTPDSSFIVGKQWMGPGLWDSSEVIIARSGTPELLKYPEVCFKYKYGIVGWQQLYQGRWRLLYSMYSHDRSHWSAPALLTSDTLNNSNVRIQSIQPDSQFFMTWQSGTAIRYRKVPAGTAGLNDTIAVSDDDSVQYDMMSNGYDMASVIWTVKHSNNNSKAVIRDIRFGTKDSLYFIDTMKIPIPVRRPRYIQSYGWRKIVFESPRSADYKDVYINTVSPPYSPPFIPYKISTSSLSAYNARGFINPVITQPSDQPAIDQAPYGHLIAYQVSKSPESAHISDSSFIRITTRLSSDSIQSNGFNRNPVLGSRITYQVGNSVGAHIPVVWESNRSGATHLYSQMYLVDILDDVDQRTDVLPSYQLDQNYPNPFNPSTTIRYHVAAAGPVTLTLHDVLGRTVAVLADRHHSAGEYHVEFSGGSLSSGIYFYRMQAGRFIRSMKMILLK